MKKRIKLSIIVICVSMLGAYTIISIDICTAATYGICATNYSSAYTTTSISRSVATCFGTISGISGKTTKTSMHLYLQKNTNGKWINVAEWTSSGNTVSRSLSKTKKVSKGYKYRSKLVCYTYIGSKSEKITRYSETKKY